MEGTEYCWIAKDGYTDSVSGVFIEPQIIGYQLENILGEELIGKGIWFGSICHHREKQFPSLYNIVIPRDVSQGAILTIQIEDLTSGGQPIYYHSRIETPILLIKNNTNLDTLPHYFDKVIDIAAELTEDCWYCGGALPSFITFTLDIIQGNEYGQIYDAQNEAYGEHFSDISTISGIGSLLGERFKFVADGIQPDSSQPGLVKIRFTPSDTSINTIECSFYVKNNDIKPVEEGLNFDFAESEIGPGDTTLLIIKKGNLDGALQEYPLGTEFEVGMLSGCEGGQILVGDSLGAYFLNVQQPIKFVASEELDTDSINITIRVGIPEIIAGKINSANTRIEYTEEQKKSLINKEEVSTIANSYCFSGNTIYDDFMDKDLKIKKEIILLGESKYYQAKFNFVKGEFSIEEIIPDTKGIPHQKTGVEGDCEWITSENEWEGFDVWGANPVSKLEGDSLGVYWERQKPIWGTDLILAPGLIRLIGRYWKKDQVHKVKLTTNGEPKNWGLETLIEIEVKKPSKLLSEDLSPTYSKSKDVFNKEYNVDSLCIYWGGLYGIPPQLIKGHIKKEAPPKNFAGYTGFSPSYRYEPFTTQFNGDIQNLIKNKNPFVVTKDSMGILGSAKVPTETEHQHVQYIHYPQSPKTVWEFVDENSQFTNINNKSSFGARYKGTPPDELKKGQMYSNLYLDINKYNKQKVEEAEDLIRKKYKIKNPKIELPLEQQLEANDSARVALIKFFKYKYKGGLTAILLKLELLPLMDFCKIFIQQL